VDGGVTFRAEHRHLSFLAAVGAALAANGSTCDVVLIADEINRADIARVFGELLYALEYRNQPVSTPYEVDGDSALTLPDNLLFIGTMNTADRSIALIDYALRRRFTFIELRPDRNAVDQAWQLAEVKSAALRLFDAVAELFTGQAREVAALAVGHSYFMPTKAVATADEGNELLATRFAFEVGPLLQEYAAEGLIPADSVSTLMDGLGVEPADTQVDVKAKVLLWLKSA
jgi:5-methylcytosine-specific restriction protein B